MKNFLYFATGGGADAAADNLVVPADTVMSINATAATTCNLYFKNPRILEDTADDSTKNYVELTYTSGKYKEVCEAIVGAINGAPATSNGFVVVADADNSKFIHSAITSVLISTADSDTNPDN
tara:strand:- start:50 stop:418 length:369 start_codon:yes stop_codon:yes gene_type:complete